MTTAELISSIAASKNISLKDLSRRANIPYTTLYSIVKRNSVPKYDALIQIADALGVSVSTLDSRLTTSIDLLSFFIDDDSVPKEKISFVVNLPDGDVISVPMSSAQGTLLYNFEQLNTEGQEKVLNYVTDLINTGRYMRENEFKNA